MSEYETNGETVIIYRNRSYGVSDSKTLEDLTEDYHDSVSRDQIEQMMKEA